MIAERRSRGIRVRAFAKINLTLRVLGVRADGYHDLRTTFQSLALHDTLTFRPQRGPFTIVCDEKGCPTDESNLVWRAARLLWRAAGRRGAIRDVTVEIAKRIPMQAGLGGGSSDGAAALRALAALWSVDTRGHELPVMARQIGADAPFFLTGGTALGVERGDLIFPMADWPSCWVVLGMPAFGVSTRDAYAWWDAGASSLATARRPAGTRSVPQSELVNDLEAPVFAVHPAIPRIVRVLRRTGAEYAAMSGSGSTVFGLFGTSARAMESARALAPLGCRVVVTRTLGRAEYDRLARPRPLGR